MSITFDGWTSRNHDSYIVVTAHFISEDMKMRNLMLKLINANDFPHTAQNLSDVIKTEVLDTTNLQCFCAVTDCAANMIATTNALNLSHIPCIAHCMHSVVTAAILKSKMGVNMKVVEKAVGNNDIRRLQYDENQFQLERMEFEELEK